MSQKQAAEKALALKRANEQRRTTKGTTALDFTDYPDRLLTATEASELLGVSTQTLANWRWAGKGPRFIRINKQTIRYPREAIKDFAGAELVVREPDAELTDAALAREIARLANRLVRRQSKAA